MIYNLRVAKLKMGLYVIMSRVRRIMAVFSAPEEMEQPNGEGSIPSGPTHAFLFVKRKSVFQKKNNWKNWCFKKETIIAFQKKNYI